MPRGRLIVIEGLDRSGKSTQCNHLLDDLLTSHEPARLYKFPDRSTAIGGMIDEYLRTTTDLDDCAIHLLFSANRWERAGEIEGLLRSGTHVICDRYIYSGITYSLIKGLDETWCRASDVGLPLPDAIFFLDLSEDEARVRGGYGDERYEKVDLQRAVKREFLRIFQHDGTVSVVDASRTVQQVRDTIWQHVQAVLKTEPGPIGKVIA